jgi:hypothetical protein
MIKKIKSHRGKADLKDVELYPAPPTHHEIVCKQCAVKARVELRYTRLCTPCRKDERRGHMEWSSWSGSSSAGLPDWYQSSWNSK